MPRLRALVVVGGALLATLLLVGLALPASARLQPAIKLKAGQSLKQTYSPLVGAGPVQASGNPGTRNPTVCRDATYCDIVPLELSVPSSLKNSDTEDYFLRLSVKWDASSASDIHIYLYNDPPTTTAIATSATANNPETLNLYRPEKAKYQLLVYNANGVNRGYEITAAITIEDFGGAPDFGGVSDPPPSAPEQSDSDSDDQDFSLEPTPDSSTGDSAAPPAAFDAPPPPLADVNQDSSLSALARRRGGLAESLAAPPRINLTQEDEGPPPEPVSGVTVALLGGVLPATLVGGGIWALRRKGGAAALPI
jgi:hypothetical protein